MLVGMRTYSLASEYASKNSTDIQYFSFEEGGTKSKSIVQHRVTSNSSIEQHSLTSSKGTA